MHLSEADTSLPSQQPAESTQIDVVTTTATELGTAGSSKTTPTPGTEPHSSLCLLCIPFPPIVDVAVATKSRKWKSKLTMPHRRRKPRKVMSNAAPLDPLPPPPELTSAAVLAPSTATPKEAIEQPKKKRGRPFKHPPHPPSEQASTAVHPPSTAAPREKKKRGHPFKHPPPPAATQPSDSALAVAPLLEAPRDPPAASNTVTAAAPPKKKKGRPFKVVNPPASEDLTASSVDEERLAPPTSEAPVASDGGTQPQRRRRRKKKRRGPPRKTQPVTRSPALTGNTQEGVVRKKRRRVVRGALPTRCSDRIVSPPSLLHDTISDFYASALLGEEGREPVIVEDLTSPVKRRRRRRKREGEGGGEVPPDAKRPMVESKRRRGTRAKEASAGQQATKGDVMTTAAVADQSHDNPATIAGPKDGDQEPIKQTESAAGGTESTDVAISTKTTQIKRRVRTKRPRVDHRTASTETGQEEEEEAVAGSSDVAESERSASPEIPLQNGTSSSSAVGADSDPSPLPLPPPRKPASSSSSSSSSKSLEDVCNKLAERKSLLLMAAAQARGDSSDQPPAGGSKLEKKEGGSKTTTTSGSCDTVSEVPAAKRRKTLIGRKQMSRSLAYLSVIEPEVGVGFTELMVGFNWSA